MSTKQLLAAVRSFSRPYTVKQSEVAALATAFSNRNRPKIPVKPLTRKGRQV